jgi:NCS2 family nucleobase:cation symporter-2
MSTGPSLVGMSNATGATSRVIGFATAAILLVFAFLPKVSGFFLLIPQEVAGSLLVFTACFMISGGMQIMLSRGADTRAAYVIGISTLLALSESVFPVYFQDLPQSIRSITASPLALSLSAAIVLSLLFRFGTRQTARTEWNDSPDQREAAISFLKAKLQAWKLPPSVVDIATKHARDVLEYIYGQHSHRLDGDLNASYNGLELRLAIRYKGSPTTHLPSVRISRIAKVDDIEDEEAAAYLGLRSFVEGLAVDRHAVNAKSQDITVNLFYAI